MESPLKFFLIFIFLFSYSICIAQDSPKDKGYEQKVIDYILNEIKKNDISFDDCLKFITPFSKWDLHSLTSSEVWFYGNLQKSSFLPNFLLGVIGKYFSISVDSLKKIPNSFLQNAVENSEIYQKDALDKASEYFDLIELVNKSGSVIFLNQDNLQRANDIYYENGSYWKYVIPEDSPFPMSDSITTDIPQQFSPEVDSVLNKMKSLGIYVIYNDDTFIYLLKDGNLDNSYGYYFKNNDLDYIKENHLFNIMREELIMPRFYYYIAN